MIIRRRYEIIGELIKRDSGAKDVFYKAFSDAKRPERDFILEADYEVIPHYAGMGSCLPNLRDILSSLDKLDEMSPYDNGLSYRDVTRIEYQPSRKGNAIQLVMKFSVADCPDRIVKVIAIDDKNTIEEWDIPRIEP
jgi:hypothetical protein